MRYMLKLWMMLLIGSMVMPGYSQGFLDRVAKKAKEKAEQKAEERAEKKLDEQIDKGLDNVEDALEGSDTSVNEGQSENSTERNKIRSMMEGMSISSEPVSVADKYHFSSKIKFHFTSLNKQGKVKDEGDVITLISPGEKNFAYQFIAGDPDTGKETSAGIFIMDFANNATIVLTEEDGEKTGVVYGIRGWDNVFSDVVDEEIDSDEGHEVLKSTGRTKNILGYKCEEYIYETDEYEGTLWITQSVKWLSADIYTSILKSKLYSQGINKGMVMESESHDKEKGTINRMTVTEVDENADVSLVLDEYQLTNLGSVKFGENEIPEEE